MPVNQAFPTVNGDVCSWADIGVDLNVSGGPSISLVDLEGIKWADKVEVGEQRGVSGGRVMGTTAGQLSTEASMTISKRGHKTLLDGLATAARAAGLVRGDQVLISGVRFSILIQHTPLGSDEVFSARLVGCRLLGRSVDAKQGNAADMVEITLNPQYAEEQSSEGDWIVLR